MSKTIAEILGLPSRVTHPVRHPEPIEGVTYDVTDPVTGEVQHIEMLAHNYSYQIQLGFDHPKWRDGIIVFEHVGDNKVKPTGLFQTPEEVREWISTLRRP